MRAGSKWSGVARVMVVITLLSPWPSRSLAQSFQFSDYPAYEKVETPAATPDEAGAPDAWKAANPIIKDIIAGEMRQGPNFAGAYFLATVGCGSGCEAIFVISLYDGEIFQAPVSATNGVLFQKDSQLIIVKENDMYDLPTKYLTFDGALFGELN